jgi:hypothetical protein
VILFIQQLLQAIAAGTYRTRESATLALGGDTSAVMLTGGADAATLTTGGDSSAILRA